jgi:hypothetical protein
VDRGMEVKVSMFESKVLFEAKEYKIGRVVGSILVFVDSNRHVM